jgi:hypothetical protein
MSNSRHRPLYPPFRHFEAEFSGSPAHLSTLAVAVLTCSLGFFSASATALPVVPDSGWRVVAWNDLGMHCMDADFRAFAILPPFNTIHAQLIDPAGLLVTVPGSITLTYEAVADASGSINRSSVGKTNFWEHIGDLFGFPLSDDQGLAGHDMPGAANTPQAMTWSPGSEWWSAEGIPLTPLDDAQAHNAYPMMRVVARNGSAVLAETRIVLPVSDEMDCSACHASGSGDAARPAAGWVNDPDPQLDYRRNILRLHDQEQLANPLHDAWHTAASIPAASRRRPPAARGSAPRAIRRTRCPAPASPT